LTRASETVFLMLWLTVTQGIYNGVNNLSIADDVHLRGERGAVFQGAAVASMDAIVNASMNTIIEGVLFNQDTLTSSWARGIQINGINAVVRENKFQKTDTKSQTPIWIEVSSKTLSDIQIYGNNIQDVFPSTDGRVLYANGTTTGEIDGLTIENNQSIPQ
jgi:hypothetical protein